MDYITNQYFPAICAALSVPEEIMLLTEMDEFKTWLYYDLDSGWKNLYQLSEVSDRFKVLPDTRGLSSHLGARTMFTRSRYKRLENKPGIPLRINFSVRFDIFGCPIGTSLVILIKRSNIGCMYPILEDDIKVITNSSKFSMPPLDQELTIDPGSVDAGCVLAVLKSRPLEDRVYTLLKDSKTFPIAFNHIVCTVNKLLEANDKRDHCVIYRQDFHVVP